MKKEGMSERLCRKIHPICDCFSVAFKQAREAEIDVPARRRFRLIFASGDTSSDLPQDAGIGLREAAARSRIGLRAFLDCLDDAKIRSGLSTSHGSTGRSGRKVVE